MWLVFPSQAMILNSNLNDSFDFDIDHVYPNTVAVTALLALALKGKLFLAAKGLKKWTCF